MKKWFAIALCFVLLLGLSACSDQPSDQVSTGQQSQNNANSNSMTDSETTNLTDNPL